MIVFWDGDDEYRVGSRGGSGHLEVPRVELALVAHRIAREQAGAVRRMLSEEFWAQDVASASEAELGEMMLALARSGRVTIGRHRRYRPVAGRIETRAEEAVPLGELADLEDEDEVAASDGVEPPDMLDFDDEIEPPDMLDFDDEIEPPAMA